MAKLSKSALKGIVKECLLEILAEGISSTTKSLTESRNTSAKKTGTFESKTRRVVKKNPALDRRAVPKKAINKSVANRVVSNLTDDPVMSQIFSDTLNGTFQEQVSSESSSPAAQHQQVGPQIVTENNDITDIGMFEDAAANWAHLAFSEKTLKSS